jgi:hypothetical protein
MNQLHEAYNVLDLEIGAPLASVLQQHRSLAMFYQLDQERFSEVNVAKSVLESHFVSREHRFNGPCACRKAADAQPVINQLLEPTMETTEVVNPQLLNTRRSNVNPKQSPVREEIPMSKSWHAFHSDPNVKCEYLNRLRDNMLSGESFQPKALPEFLRTYELVLNIPWDVGVLIHLIFINRDSSLYPLYSNPDLELYKFLNAITPGAQLDSLSRDFYTWCSKQYQAMPLWLEIFGISKEKHLSDEVHKLENLFRIGSRLGSEDADAWNNFKFRLYPSLHDDPKVKLLYNAASVGAASIQVKAGVYEGQEMDAYVTAVNQCLASTVSILAERFNAWENKYPGSRPEKVKRVPNPIAAGDYIRSTFIGYLYKYM